MRQQKNHLLSVGGRLGILLSALLTLGIDRASHAAQVTTNTLLAGTRFATDCFIHDSGQPGPTIMIVGGVHGNEPAGANAAEQIRQWPLTKGRLIVIPRANVPGLAANKRLIPDLDTNLNNLNRDYPRAGKEEGPRGELAKAIWAVAEEYKPDWLLDLHEGFDFHQLNDHSVGSSVIAFPNDQGNAAADLMLSAVNATITNTELKFVLRRMPIDGSLARAGGEHLHIPAMTLETTSKQPMDKRIYQHEVLVHRLLQNLDMVNGELAAYTAPTGASPKPAAAAMPLRVALYEGPGTGGEGPPSLLKSLNQPGSSITQVTPEQIQQGVLTNFNVVIFAGGSGSKQAAALGEPGRDAVIKFVGEGGGYVGICAGAYLATSGYPWSMHFVNAKTVSPKWQRGRTTLKVELTDKGREIFGTTATNIDVIYHNGPVVQAAGLDTLPAYEALGYFRTEVASNGTPVGVQINSPAMLAGEFKKGRVVFISPHPEQTEGLEALVPHAVMWVAPQNRTTTAKAATEPVNTKAE